MLNRRILNERKENGKEVNLPQSNQKTKDYAKVNNGVFVYTSSLTVSELAKKLNVQPSDIIKKLFMQKKLVTINQYLDDETIGELCLEYGYDFKKEEIVNEEDFEKVNLEDDQKIWLKDLQLLLLWGMLIMVKLH